MVKLCTRHQDRPHGEAIAVTQLGRPFILPEDKSQIILSYDVEGEIGALGAAEVGQGRVVAIASHPEAALVDLPSFDALDPVKHSAQNLPQGDARLLMKNAVLWVAGVEY